MRRGAVAFALAAALGTSAPLVASVARADVAACIASSEQALALRKQGKLHDALKQLAQCADPACPAEVSAECTQRIAALGAAMPTLVLVAKDGAGNDLVDVKVSMDGSLLTQKLDGIPLAIDPGEHAFHFEVAGQPPLDKQLVLREGDKDRHETVVLGPTSATPPATPPAPGAAPTSSPSSAAAGWWTTRHTLVVVGAGLGVAGVALGSIFGGLAISTQNQEKSSCGPVICNFTRAQQDYTQSGQDATVSTVGFIAGGALLAGAAVLWFTQPSDAPVPTAAAQWHLVPSVGDRAGSLILGGEF